MCGYNVHLHQLVGSVSREGACGRHRTFIESTLRTDAVIATISQKDSSLLSHGVVGGIDARSVEHHRQGSALGVSSHGGPVMRFTLGNGCHKPPGDSRQLCAVLRAILVAAAYEIVLLVGNDPWTRRDSVVPAVGVAVVGGLHGAIVIVAAVVLGVAVVEATAIIEVQSID